MTYWIFLHHKCASQHLRAAISAAGQAAGRLTAISALDSLQAPPKPEHVAQAMRTTQYCLDDNAWASLPDTLDALTGTWTAVHFIRDPRDLLVSAYWAHRYSHGLNIPGLEAHRRALEGTSIDQGLLLDLQYPITRQAIESILDFPQHPRVHTYDAIEAATEAIVFAQALGDLDIPWVEGASIAGWPRADHTEDNHQHYRHGVQGDWERYFTPQVERVFMDQYGVRMRDGGWLR